MNSSLSFNPVQGAESKIKSHGVQDGNLYFATDTGKMFLDANGKRISVGGAGAAIYYAKGQVIEHPAGYWIISKADMVNVSDSPSLNDIILNVDDGTFYKVELVTQIEYQCSRLSISGGTNSGTVAMSQPTLQFLEFGDNNVINGSKVGVWFVARSALDQDGLPLNSKLTIEWKLYEGDYETGTMYYSSTFQVESGVETYLEFGEYLRNSTKSTLTMVASGNNHDKSSYLRSQDITTTALTLKMASGFSNLDPFNRDKVRFTVFAEGDIDKTLDITFDGVLLDPNKYSSVGGKIPQGSSKTNFDIAIPAELCDHGAHSIQVDLYQLVNGARKQNTTPIQFEVAVNNNSDVPIVWLGNYNKIYYTYDSIQIPYLAYDPKSPNEAKVQLYKNGVQYKDDERIIKSREKFQIWEISDADNESTNRYEISCGSLNEARENSKRKIEFQVLKDKRDLTIAKSDFLRLNFDPKGRSNNESKLKRDKWSYEGIDAKFINFNWYNNGWMMDDSNRTYLRISNGAKFELPLGVTQFAGGEQDTQSHTFELMFKIRNIQNYADLITNVTRYTFNNQPDDELYADYEKSGFDNYDAYLQYTLKGEYDKLEFAYVDKLINLSNAVCRYCDTTGLGWAFGPQDAFFKDLSKTVSVSYVEDELVSLSLVFKYDPAGRNMILFYLNGIITGVAYTSGTSFTINSSITFDSSNCDIDLYKLRVYETPLDVYDVVKNYCVDRTDIDNFDMLSLAKENTEIKEYQISYEEVIAWNEANPGNQTMPYIIYDTTNGDSNDRLSYSKSNPVKATITFVNTQLDRAYALGELEDLAAADGLFDPEDPSVTATQRAEAVKTYYKHHCPSWTGDNCELVVQGTSSEYYPRRNYKIKTKTKYDADGKERIHIFLNKGPFEAAYRENPEDTRQDYWYMNSYTGGTHKWTMKVDYMESSGSYNAGFASMVGTAYTKHPLEDYIAADVINTTVTEYKKDSEGNPTNEIKKKYNGLAPIVNFAHPVSSDPLSNANIRWRDYRTSLLGFPVMAFHKKADGYTFIGYYRMLLDKGSDEVLGFKPPKGVTNKLLGNKDVRKKAECWEFSNNNRTYCSYRDPWDRVELSFNPPSAFIEDGTGLTSAAVPIVADSFEYRYNDNEDYLDILYNLGKKDDNGNWGFAGKEKDVEDFLKETGIDISTTSNWPAARAKMLDYYKNWEDACKWVWSTCPENVISMGGAGNGYQEVKVGDTPFTTDGSLWITVDEEHTQITSGTYDSSIDYWKRVKSDNKDENGEDIYIFERAYVYDPTDIDDNGQPRFKYEIDKFYQEVDGVYSLSSDGFDSTISYYILVVDEDYVSKYSNLLVAPATEYIPGTQYYTYDPSVTNADVRKGILAVNPVTISSAQEFAAGTYYVASPVVYSSGTFTHDTQEYRAEKFKKELSSHFDLEYLATYFIMTEVFECYDSRGKNCMMATWGPLVEGGDYIWYPIFYDIDTQLGINNTGIPSFTFNIDATLNDNFSTSDSVLWNNLYAYFRSSYILQKYMHLKGLNSTIYNQKLAQPPLEFISTLEDWYLFDYDVTKNLATKGHRPLIATNLDAWYKYITITNIVGSTNKQLLENGTVGYMNRTGGWSLDSNGTYFYALQGDRKQSRRSFLTKRIDFIDSWLGVGDYARSGNNCIWGRVSANDSSDTSDVWLEGNPTDEKYWIVDAEGNETNQKTHAFDAQYWLDLKPIYSTYVTVSDDAAAYPPVKYDGNLPVNIKSTAIESGVRRSPNYKEQLLYIYGSDKMLDIGDMSNLYWREFKIDGKASKLTRLKLGHDGVVRDYKYDARGNKVYEDQMTWKNGYLNQPSIPAGLGSSGMPLLKEANFCNITIQAGASDPILDLRTCEKLENFRATGSNLTQVIFADGVALNTLYLPATVASLSLVEANLLTDVLKTYTIPQSKENGGLEAIPGIYLEGFFDNRGVSALKNLSIQGGSLGYGSFDIFKHFYDLRHGTPNNRLTMTDVEWCPFTPVVDGDAYDINLKYYIDDGHYGLQDYTYTTEESFKGATLRGELYYANYKPVTFNSEEAFNADKRDKYYKQNNEYILATAYKNTISDYFVVIGDDALDESGNYKIQSNIYTILKNLITDSNFRSVENANNPTNLSGIIYIDNMDGSAIDEAEIANVMQTAYPNMKFFVTNARQAYSAKFVVINTDGTYSYVPDINGDDTLDSIQKVSQADFTNGLTEFENPYNMYDPTKSKSHYDFIGWRYEESEAANNSNVLLVDEKDYWGTNYKGHDWGIIKQGEYSQTYYATFNATYYKAHFIDRDNSDYKEIVSIQYDPQGKNRFHTNVIEPVPVRSTDDDYRYTLKGWTTTENYGGYYDSGVDVSGYLSNVSTIPVIEDIYLYAVFQLESVYDNPTDSKYFDATEVTINGVKGWSLYLNTEYYNMTPLKITIPTTFTKIVNNKPVTHTVISLGKFNNANTPLNITHIFLMPDSQCMTIENKFYEGGAVEAKFPKLEVFKFPEGMTTLTHIGNDAFSHCTNLRSINLPDSIVSIGDNALSTTTQMMKYTMTKLPESLTRIGEKAFQKSLISLTSLPKSLTSIGYRAFNDCPNVQIIEFGGDSNWAIPSQLTTIGGEAFRNAGNGIVGNTIIIRQSVTTIKDTPFTNYGGLDNRITVYYTHLTGFKYTAADLGVADVQPLTFEQ